ncbi:MAG: nuclear transport factor 2 family protein [Ekhidna sp.]|nr:nuclear transport factor 2 family protein [Ekhidna sp.]
MKRRLIGTPILSEPMPYSEASDLNTNETPSEVATEINATVLGYIENFFVNDFDEMAYHFHSAFSKVGISKSRGSDDTFYESMKLEQLESTLTSKPYVALENQKNEVTILDVFRNTACVRLETGYPEKMRWIEYIVLSKEEDRWLINSIIWDCYPRKSK